MEVLNDGFKALRAAMAMEMSEQRMYDRYAQEASSAEAKHFFTQLAEYKAMHLRSLQAELGSPGTVQESVGSSKNDVSGDNGIDLTHCQLNLSITESEVKVLEKANEEMLRQQLRYNQELAIAADIQRKLLPQEFPQDMGLQIAASSTMAKAVGGDYYDLNKNQDGQLSLIVADSMGKGMPAALLMTTVRAIWRGCSITCCQSPGQVLETINGAMYADLKATESFITMLGAIYDPTTAVFQYSSAGHSPAVFCQASEAEYKVLDEGGLPVGILPDSEFPSDEVLMQEGDVIVMYTDGVVEAEGDGHTLFGLERLCDIVDQNRGSDAESIKNAILSAVDYHIHGSPLTDDTTIVVLKKN